MGEAPGSIVNRVAFHGLQTECAAKYGSFRSYHRSQHSSSVRLSAFTSRFPIRFPGRSGQTAIHSPAKWMLRWHIQGFPFRHLTVLSHVCRQALLCFIFAAFRHKRGQFAQFIL